jgi:hypothetical protein
MEPRRSQARPGSEAVRVTSADPRRDAWLIGHDGGMPRTVLDARNAALRRRFVALLADGTSGELAASQRAERLLRVLEQVARAYDGIADDLTMLECVNDGAKRRDQLMIETVDELTAMAELSTGESFAATTWSEALVAFRSHIEDLVEHATDDVAALMEIELAIERIEYVKKRAAAAKQSYLGYISA